MPLENRNLKTGTVLQARYKGRGRTCEVVHTADGLRYRLDDGREFTSPSSAGKAAMNGVACNGWRFWSVEGTETPKRTVRSTASHEPKAKVEKPTKPTTKKAPPKKAAKGKAKKAARKKVARAKSSGSYGCGVCGESFPTMKAATKHALTHTAA